MTIQHGYSKRTPSGTAASVQKRRTLYLAESDPRVKSGSISAYENSYYAEIKIVSDEEYLKLLKQQIGVQYSSAEDAIVLTNIAAAPAIPTLQTTEITSLVPPTNFSVTYEPDTINGGNLLTAVISFDVPDNYVEDGSIKYIHTTATLVSAASPKATNLGATANKPVVASTMSFVHQTSSQMSLKWKGYTDAIGYKVQVTAVNSSGTILPASSSVGYVPNANGKKHTFYPQIPPTLDSSGYITFNVPTPPSPHAFSGYYAFDVYVVYPKNTSNPTRKVSINV